MSIHSLSLKRWKLKPWHMVLYAVVGVIVLGVVGAIAYIIRVGGGTLPVSGQAPHFRADNVLTHKPFAMTDVNGKLVLITWYYTHCTDVCPLTMYRFQQVQQQLEKDGTFGKKVVLISMTLDPARDTAPVIRQYAAHFHANAKGWYFLRATPGQTVNILKSWGIQVKPDTNKEFLEHTSKTELIDQNGNIRAAYNTANLNPSQVLSNIHSLIARMNWYV